MSLITSIRKVSFSLGLQVMRSTNFNILTFKVASLMGRQITNSQPTVPSQLFLALCKILYLFKQKIFVIFEPSWNLSRVKNLKFFLVVPTCNDGVKNGNETDMDCGGSCLSNNRCRETQRCINPSDCNSGICKLNICQGECSYYRQVKYKH